MLKHQHIQDNAGAILADLPEGVILVAAAKGRTTGEVSAALDAGVRTVGHNYVQEAGAMVAALGDRANWHMIGHLQRNKAKRAVELFDLIETLDSKRLAATLDRQATAAGVTVPVLIEVNSGREASKAGVLPEALDDLVDVIASMPGLAVQGLMTMGPAFGDPELARPYFRATREAFERLQSSTYANVHMRFLSMGMSNSYRVALAEGANMIRLGTAIFGPRAE